MDGNALPTEPKQYLASETVWDTNQNDMGFYCSIVHCHWLYQVGREGVNPEKRVINYNKVKCGQSLSRSSFAYLGFSLVSSRPEKMKLSIISRWLISVVLNDKIYNKVNPIDACTDCIQYRAT